MYIKAFDRPASHPYQSYPLTPSNPKSSYPVPRVSSTQPTKLYTNLANSTPQGLNLKKIINKNRAQIHRNPQLNSASSLLEEKKQEKMKGQEQIQVQQKFYQPSYFGVTLRSNRLREIKSKYRSQNGKNRGNFSHGPEDVMHEKVKEELLDIISKKGFKLSKNKNRDGGKKNKVLQFTVAGRPVSRQNRIPILTQRKIQNEDNSINTPNTQQNIHLSHQGKAVLDLSKLSNYVPNRVHTSKSPQLNYYPTQTQIYNNFLTPNRAQKTFPIRMHLTSYPYKNLIQNPVQHKNSHEFDSPLNSQPQIIIDYRRSMSQGRRRSFVQKQRITGDRWQVQQNVKNSTNNLIENCANGKGQNVPLKPWAVRKLDDEEEDNIDGMF